MHREEELDDNMHVEDKHDGGARRRGAVDEKQGTGSSRCGHRENKVEG